MQRRKLTPPQLAKRWGVNVNKVTGFIRSGELVAINLAGRGCTRPRYAIDETDVEAFEAARRVIPDSGVNPTQHLRRRATPGIKQFV